MRRLAVLLAAFVFVAACHHGRVSAGVPKSNSSTVKISDSDLEGVASYYAEPYHGRRTANGEVFDTYNGMTAAHKTLPFNTVVRVKNLDNGEEVDVRINDRGPFIKGRVIDLSLIAAQQIDLVRPGIAPVKLKILKEGSPPTKPATPSAAQAVAAAPPVPPPSPAPNVPLPATPQESGTINTVIAPLFGVQVGAFQSESAAIKLRDDLALRYSNVSIQSLITDRSIYRVRVGSVMDMESAERLAKQLRDEHLNTFIVRLN